MIITVNSELRMLMAAMAIFGSFLDFVIYHQKAFILRKK